LVSQSTAGQPCLLSAASRDPRRTVAGYSRLMGGMRKGNPRLKKAHRHGLVTQDRRTPRNGSSKTTVDLDFGRVPECRCIAVLCAFSRVQVGLPRVNARSRRRRGSSSGVGITLGDVIAYAGPISSARGDCRGTFGRRSPERCDLCQSGWCATGPLQRSLNPPSRQGVSEVRTSRALAGSMSLPPQSLA